ncbi:hypothetical protein T484DRAFT_1947843 [Baffinella frigidus]|nr:hypothetical protein T484DRAFT_1947843 [Cryptophyta sp. CCMP2293]
MAHDSTLVWGAEPPAERHWAKLDSPQVAPSRSSYERNEPPAERPGAKLESPPGSPTRSSYRLRVKHNPQTKFPLPEEPHAGIKHQLVALPRVHEPAILRVAALFKRGFASTNSPRLPSLPKSLQGTPRDDAVSAADTFGRTSDTSGRSLPDKESLLPGPSQPCDDAMLSPSERFRLRHLVLSRYGSDSPRSDTLRARGWDPAPSPRGSAEPSPRPPVFKAFSPRLPGQVPPLPTKGSFSSSPHARRAEKRELRAKRGSVERDNAREERVDGGL